MVPVSMEPNINAPEVAAEPRAAPSSRCRPGGPPSGAAGRWPTRPLAVEIGRVSCGQRAAITQDDPAPVLSGLPQPPGRAFASNCKSRRRPSLSVHDPACPPSPR